MVGILDQLEVLVYLGLPLDWVRTHLDADGVVEELWLQADTHHGISFRPQIMVPQHGASSVGRMAPQSAWSQLLALAEAMAFQYGHDLVQPLVHWLVGANDGLHFMDDSLWDSHGKWASVCGSLGAAASGPPSCTFQVAATYMLPCQKKEFSCTRLLLFAAAALDHCGTYLGETWNYDARPFFW